MRRGLNNKYNAQLNGQNSIIHKAKKPNLKFAFCDEISNSSHDAYCRLVSICQPIHNHKRQILSRVFDRPLSTHRNFVTISTFTASS